MGPLVIGLGWVYICWSSFLVKLKIDDAVDAIPVHFGNGCSPTGLFASSGLVDAAYGTPNYGLFYNWGMGNGSGKLSSWLLRILAFSSVLDGSASS